MHIPLARSAIAIQVSDESFREQLARNLGSPATYCMGMQNDLLYMPMKFAEDWARVATQMTELGLPFTFPFYTAIYGIAPVEEMVVLHTHYLEVRRANYVLKGDPLSECESLKIWWKLKSLLSSSQVTRASPSESVSLMDSPAT